ncbi:MAG: ABC transporter ATP-binding protein [Armatimonadetes bacterium]|jgi:ABC-2 type transport system ATP-binding protein|nr:ABC transporter ATP-binding protein [Armatimonadota bacterium]HOC30860.1 ABC transporter ATP-binding protein [Armatimonadota bacterium]
MINLQNASRWYGQVLGINDISCAIEPGITALLGPNGAGKSTMLKLVTGQLRPTTGCVTVFEERPFANPRVFRRMGYTPEMENSYDDLTGYEYVDYLATLSGVPKTQRKTAVESAIERVVMTANMHRKIGGYSKGMRQRIKVAQAIVHEPELLILDEPLNGLDPVGRHEVSTLLHDYGREGRTVLVSSHILYEVEQLTQRILLLNHGRLLAQGSIRQIRDLIDAHPHRIEITSTDARSLARDLMGLPYILSARLDGPSATKVEVETRAPEMFYSTLPEIALSNGYRITAFSSPDNNLEAVFRYLVTDKPAQPKNHLVFAPAETAGEEEQP